MISLNHIALQYPNRKMAKEFFGEVLGFSSVQTFSIPPELSGALFGIQKEVDIEIYSNGKISFEIFFDQDRTQKQYEHIALNTSNISGLFSRCKKYGIKTMVVPKGGKKLYFIRDKAGYLYEIKEEKG